MELKDLLALAKHNLSTDNDLIPVLILETEDNGVIIMDVSAKWVDRRIRQEFIFQLGSTIGFGNNIKRMFAIQDAYVKVWDGEGKPSIPDTGLKDDAAAKECIVILEMTGPGKNKGVVCPYERVVNGLKVDIVYKDTEEAAEGLMDSFMFDEFWEAKEKAEERIFSVSGIARDHVFEDTGETAIAVARRAARRLAIQKFGANILSGSIDKN